MNTSFPFESAHNYAKRNGYKGSYNEYVKLQFKGYCETCKRCEIKPMNFEAWKNSKLN